LISTNNLGRRQGKAHLGIGYLYVSICVEAQAAAEAQEEIGETLIVMNVETYGTSIERDLD
jgi:hypothetical protein